MTKLVMSLLPTQYDSLDDLYKRRNTLVQGKPVDGIVVNLSDPDVQMVIKALNAAINKRRDQPKKFAFKEKKVDRTNCGKTERNKSKDSYKNPVDKKKAKSEESRAIRQEMQSGKKK